MAHNASARVVLADQELRAVAEGHAGPLVIKTTVKILSRAKILCPVDTGNLRASLQMQITKTGDIIQGNVYTTVNYAKYVHDGTAPHIIRPRRAGGVLRFPVPPRSSNIVFTREVHHPGTRARPFLRLAIEQVAPGEGFATT